MKPDSFKDFVIDQLHGLPDFLCRSMFGGYGLYAGDRFFGIIFKGRLYFKVDAQARLRYVQAGMKPFRPNKTQTLKSFYEVPADVLESTEQLADWAGRAVACANTVGRKQTKLSRHA